MFFAQFMELCSQHNKSVYKVVAEIGLSRSVINRWKTGSVPNGNTLNKIAQYFDVSVNRLLSANTPSEEAKGPETPTERDPDEYLMYALFDGEATPEQLEEVKKFAAYVKARDGK